MNIGKIGFCFLATFALISPSLSFAAEPGRLLFFGVAYDEAPGPGQTIQHYDYAPDNFTRLFQAQSTPLFAEVKSAAVKGNYARKETIAAGLKAIGALARPQDVVILYWGTHGGTDATGWSSHLLDGGLMRGSEIKEALGKLPCPAVAVISTCGSGGFLKQNSEGIDLPPNVAAFCACSPTGSTNNELDVALLEGLAGFADRNADGRVTLREVMDYVPRRYSGLQFGLRHGSIAPVIGRAEKISADLPLTKVTGEHAAAAIDGTWRGATILERGRGKVKVRFLGFDSTTTTGAFSLLDRELNEDQVDFAGGHPPIMVERAGSWQPAQVVADLFPKPGYRVRYLNRPASETEEVPPRRIRFPFGE